MPEISVIMPCYQLDKTVLRKAIESVLKQSFQDFELLVVLDGKDEKIECLCQEYEDRGEQFRVLIQPHRGVSAARNTGIEAATGRYLSFVDGDDFVEPEFLAYLYEAIRESDLSVCGVAEQDFPVEGGQIDRRTFFSHPEKYCQLQYVNFSVNKLYRSEIIERYALRFDEAVKQGEDALFLAGYLAHCETFSMIGTRLYHYVPNSGSATHTFFAELWEWESQVIEKQWELFTQHPLPLCEENALYFWLYLKLRWALDRYLDADVKEKDQYIRGILESVPCQRLMQAQLGQWKHFRLKSRLSVALWRRLGVTGVKLWRYLRHS